MHRYHVRAALRRSKFSWFDRHLVMLGILSIVAGIVLALANESAGGPARAVGLAGLVWLVLLAVSRGVRLYRVGDAASLPRSVARVRVRIHPRRVSTLATVALALFLPALLCIAFLARVEWAWLAIATLLFFASFPMLADWLARGGDEAAHPMPDPATIALLERLCMRADIAVPEVVVESSVLANAWTSGGRIHLTDELLLTLDRNELEAVLAHELAHLAHRDAAVMEVCSAPSRWLLAVAVFLANGLRGWIRSIAMDFSPVSGFLIGMFAVLAVPPALVLGWVSRLSVLWMSRAREFAADAAAATLTGRPGALASALLKLDPPPGWNRRTDLRELEARAVLCIVGRDKSKLGPFFCTHPATIARVRRLEELERRLQAG